MYTDVWPRSVYIGVTAADTCGFVCRLFYQNQTFGREPTALDVILIINWWSLYR